VSKGSRTERRAHHHPPTNLHEYQKKGVTEFAIRNSLILTDAFLAVFGLVTAGLAARKKEKRSKLPRLYVVIYKGKCIRN
jgi:hypothetical protein